MFFNDKYQKLSRLVLIVTLTLLSLVFAYYIFRTFSYQDFLPARSDQVAYFLEAKGFAATGLLNTFLTMHENTSIILDCGAHGPVYALLHGTVAKIFGLRGFNFVILNIIFLGLYLFLILKNKSFDKEQKLIISILQLGYFTTLFFIFSLNQETIHLMFAGFLTVKLIEIYRKQEGSKELLWQDVLWFCVILAVCSSFRFGWALWSIGLLPLAKNLKDLIKLFFVFLFISALGHLYRMYFHAPDNYGLVKNVVDMLKDGQVQPALQALWKNFLANIPAYFWQVYKFSAYYYSKIIYFIVTVYFLYFGIRKNDKLVLAASLIGFINLLALFVLYDAYDYREIRGLAPVLSMLIVIMILRKFRILTTIFFIYVVVTFPFIFKEFHWLIYDKHVASTQLYFEGKTVNFASLANLKSNGKKSIIVLIPERLYWQLAPGAELNIKNVLHTSLLTLPAKNFEGVPMRYTFNDQNLEPMDKQWGKMDIDYVLLMNGMVVNNSPEIKRQWGLQ